MIEINDLQYLLNENNKMIEMIESMKIRIESNNEILVNLLNSQESESSKSHSKSKASKASKASKDSKDIEVTTESNEQSNEQSNEGTPKKKTSKKGDIKAIESITDKLKKKGKENIEVELIKVDKTSYFVDKDGVVYNKKAKIIGKYSDDETIILD